MLQLKTTLIIACDGKFNIGNKGQLLFRIKEDLESFKNQTMGKNLYMGRKTFEATGPLPGRRMIVLSHGDVSNADEVINDVTEFKVRMIKDENGMLIGGGELVKLFYPNIGRILMTKTKECFKADTCMDDPELHGFFIKKQSPYFESDGLHFQFVEYVRWINEINLRQ